MPVVCYRPEWRAEQVPCVVQKVNYRREVTQVNVQVMVPRQFDEQVRSSYYVPVPREVERDVPRCVMTPFVCIDPCTCCPIVMYYPQWVNQRVRCVEYDYRREERVDNVRVWRCVAENRAVDQVRWIPEVTQEQSVTVRYTCVMVPYQSWTWAPCWH